ncbi:MAG: DUF2231 domain-containing protein [Alphaproteobacteria bacterium]|nr:DUF2231 domain-containing protein [Alphaproteobacteria bacterium]
MSDHNPQSTAKIAGHPLHPMIVPFPIAFFVSALVTDLIYLATDRAGFADASVWLIGAGLAAAALAGILGLADFLGDRMVRGMSQAWMHLVGNGIAVLLEIANLAVRAVGGAQGGLAPTGIVLSAIVTAVLVFTGWMGGEMVYRRHVGVADAAEAKVRVRGR